jgi:putative transposase
VHGCTRKIRRMLENGRLHLYAATIRYAGPLVGHADRAGRPVPPGTSDNGRPASAACGTRPGREVAGRGRGRRGTRAARGQGGESVTAGADRVAAGEQGPGENKPGSAGRHQAKDRLTRIHARVAHLRAEAAHKLAYWAATRMCRLTVEDLNVAGMTQLHSLARAITDAGIRPGPPARLQGPLVWLRPGRG